MIGDKGYLAPDGRVVRSPLEPVIARLSVKETRYNVAPRAVTAVEWRADMLAPASSGVRFTGFRRRDVVEQALAHHKEQQS